jgi:hypothetical protein
MACQERSCLRVGTELMQTRERFVLAAREAGLLPSEMRREGKLPFATGGKLHQSINASAESPPVVNRP